MDFNRFMHRNLPKKLIVSDFSFTVKQHKLPGFPPCKQVPKVIVVHVEFKPWDLAPKWSKSETGTWNLDISFVCFQVHSYKACIKSPSSSGSNLLWPGIRHRECYRCNNLPLDTRDARGLVVVPGSGWSTRSRKSKLYQPLLLICGFGLSNKACAALRDFGNVQSSRGCCSITKGPSMDTTSHWFETTRFDFWCSHSITWQK